MPIAYSYDGTFDGFLSAVFTAYARHEEPEEIAACGQLQEMFGRGTLEIATDTDHARRVENGVVSKMGSPAWQKIWTVFLSGDADKATALYRYIRRGLVIGRCVYDDIAHPDVLPVENLHRHISNEAHLLRGFVRFSLMEGGVYYARITPKNSAVPLLMPHFADRFSTQPFLLHDPVHELAGVYDLKEWRLVETGGLTLPPIDESEPAFRRMWQRFYETIAIAERTNHTCRRSHMPLRYWKNMTEHGHIKHEPTHTEKPDGRAHLMEY